MGINSALIDLLCRCIHLAAFIIVVVATLKSLSVAGVIGVSVIAPADCSQVARQYSLKRVRKKYQASRKGRFNNAARQQRFRQRQKQKVTDQCSLQIPRHTVLQNKAN